jgi:hypothetical protein
MNVVGCLLPGLLLALWSGMAPCADPGAAQKLDEEVSRQEKIYQSRGEKRPEGYVIDRSLESYSETLPPAFGRALAGLGPKERWLDIGAGQGQAVLDYAIAKDNPGQRAQVVALSIEDRRTPAWNEAAARLGQDRIQYLSGKRLREYAVAELGRFRIITDVIGGFSYTENLSVFMEKVLGMLELNGSFFTLLQDVHAEDGSNKPYYQGASYLTRIVDAGNPDIRVCSWLKSISCVEVTCELRTAWKPPIEVYGIRKVCNEVRVPPLESIHFEAGTPPERSFRLAK